MGHFLQGGSFKKRNYNNDSKPRDWPGPPSSPDTKLSDTPEAPLEAVPEVCQKADLSFHVFRCWEWGHRTGLGWSPPELGWVSLGPGTVTLINM